jgi:hypothetical protein
MFYNPASPLLDSQSAWVSCSLRFGFSTFQVLTQLPDVADSCAVAMPLRPAGLDSFSGNMVHHALLCQLVISALSLRLVLLLCCFCSHATKPAGPDSPTAAGRMPCCAE